MKYSLIIRPEAEADINDAFLWYESQSTGLGHEFLRCIEAGFLAVEQMPEMVAKIYCETRRILIRRFPYAVFYTVFENYILVIAVMHVSRHPRRWQNRSQKK